MIIFIRDVETYALIDEIEFTCKYWKDPEEKGIKGYVLYAKKGTEKKAKPMLKVSQFDPSSPSLIRLPLGKFTFLVEVMDTWGAKIKYTIAENLDIIEPTNEERITFEDSGIKGQIKECKSIKILINEENLGKWQL